MIKREPESVVSMSLLSSVAANGPAPAEQSGIVPTRSEKLDPVEIHAGSYCGSYE